MFPSVSHKTLKNIETSTNNRFMVKMWPSSSQWKVISLKATMGGLTWLSSVINKVKEKHKKSALKVVFRVRI